MHSRVNYNKYYIYIIHIYLHIIHVVYSNIIGNIFRWTSDKWQSNSGYERKFCPTISGDG